MRYSKSLIGTLIGWLLWGSLMVPSVQALFQRAGCRWAYIALFAFLLSLLLTPLIRSIALRYSILDYPEARKMHAKATPLLGGVAIYLSFSLALLVNRIFDRSVVSIMLAASIIVIISAIDDIRELSAKFKLVAQIGAATLVMLAGTQITVFPTNDPAASFYAVSVIGNIILTFLWIVGITNAMNFLDGIDGLAAGLGAVISMFLGIIAFQTGQPFLGWFAIAMMGSCLGFLPYNFRRSGPALIFLGDTGSTFIGFTLACLAIKGDWAEQNPLVSICTPLLIFGVLIFDMIHITVSRIATGKVKNFHEWVAYVGKDHIHHRLNRIFLSRKKTVFCILALNCGLGISAVVLRQVDTFHSLLIVFQGVLAFSVFSMLNLYQEKAMERLNHPEVPLQEESGNSSKSAEEEKERCV